MPNSLGALTYVVEVQIHLVDGGINGQGTTKRLCGCVCWGVGGTHGALSIGVRQGMHVHGRMGCRLHGVALDAQPPALHCIHGL